MKLLTGLTFPFTFHPSRLLAFNACVLATPLKDGANASHEEMARRVAAIPKNFIVGCNIVANIRDAVCMDRMDYKKDVSMLVCRY
jgi:hypothetical protein